MNKNNSLFQGKKTVEVKAENVVGTREEVLNKLSLILGKSVKVHLVTEDYFVVSGGYFEVYVYLLPDFIYVGKYEVFRRTRKKGYYTVKDRVGYSLIDSNANWITEKRYYSIDHIGENYFKVVERSIVNGRYLRKVGCVDLKGIEVISANYTDIRHLIKDLFLCTTDIDAVSIQSILRAGNIRAIPFPVEDVRTINDTSIAIKSRNKWGFYNAKIKALTGFDYDSIESNFEVQRKTIIATKGELKDLVLLDDTGVYILWENAEVMENNLSGQLTFIKDGEKSIIVRDDGEVIYEFKGTNKPLRVKCEDYTSNIIVSSVSRQSFTGIRYDGTSVKLEGACIYVFKCTRTVYYATGDSLYSGYKHLYDENLNLIWDKYRFWLTWFEEHLNIEKDNKVGLFDLNTYTTLVPMEYGLIKRIGKLEGFKYFMQTFDSYGKRITYWSMVKDNKKGVMRVKDNGYEIVLECKYEDCEMSIDSNNSILFILTLDGKTYLCDYNGNKLSAGFDRIYLYQKDYFIVERNTLKGLINNKGILITTVSHSDIIAISEFKKEVEVRTVKGNNTVYRFLSGAYKDPDKFKS